MGIVTVPKSILEFLSAYAVNFRDVLISPETGKLTGFHAALSNGGVGSNIQAK